MVFAEDEEVAGRAFRDEDWYAESLGRVTFRDCTFTDVDLTECTTDGTTFTGCTFSSSRLNASTHTASSFAGCEFRRTRLFGETRLDLAAAVLLAEAHGARVET
jgi:uncharacterized protein YjbI with pentapeptide repeats